MNTQTYTVNIRTGVVNITRVDVSQGDTGRTLAFSLYDGLSSFTPPTGSTVTIVGRKPSKLGFSEACTVSGNVATVTTTLAMTQEAGKFPVELRIEANGESIGTANFTMYVEPSPHPAGTTDGTTEEARAVLAQCEEYAQIAQEAAEAASGDYTQLSAEIGTLSELTTTAKSSAVAAINEVNNGLSDVRADLEDLDERLDSLGDGVPTEVRQAMLALFNSAAYAETGLTDEVAVIESWAAVVTAISLNQSSISISGASTSQLVATTTPAGEAVSWASSDTSVATVSNSGLVTGVGNGSCTITASCGGKTATCSVTVSGFATLTSISAVYTQSGTVYNTDTLDSLKDDLVVTAHYDDTTTATVPSADYTLSGTLEVGISTIVVSYGGKTTTFNVTVSEMEIINVTYTQGSIGAGNTDADRVSGVIESSLHFGDGETYIITVPDGYSVVPFGFVPKSDQTAAGTKSSTSANNILNAYVVSDSSYVVPNIGNMNGTLYANTKILNNKGDAGWMTDTITYTFTKTGQSSYTFTGLGFLVKENNNANITPSDIESLITISKVEA